MWWSKKCTLLPRNLFAHLDLQSLSLYPFTDGWHPFVVVAEVIYFLFLLYYMIVQVRSGQWFHGQGMEMALCLFSLPSLHSSLGWGRKQGGGRCSAYLFVMATFGGLSAGPEG